MWVNLENVTDACAAVSSIKQDLRLYAKERHPPQKYINLL